MPMSNLFMMVKGTSFVNPTLLEISEKLQKYPEREVAFFR